MRTTKRAPTNELMRGSSGSIDASPLRRRRDPFSKSTNSRPTDAFSERFPDVRNMPLPS
jgi:hypothetical protein